MKSPIEQLQSLQEMYKKGSVNKTEYGQMLSILLQELEKMQESIKTTKGEINAEISRFDTSDKIGNEKIFSVIIKIIILLAIIFALVYLS
jgi:hypothetical protein